MKYFITLVFTTLFVCAFSPVLRAQAENEVIFTFRYNAGVQPLELNQTVFPVWDGTKVTLKRAAFYLSEIELIRSDSTTLPLEDLYLLVNAGEADPNYPAGAWPVEQIIGVVLHIGVDSAHNHLDPSGYPAGHPLGHQKDPMHWGWVAGYRFLSIDGKVDQDNDGVPEEPLEYHNIGDKLYKSVILDGRAKAENGILRINIDLDFARLFQGIDLSGLLIYHGDKPANMQMMDNAANAGFIKMAATSATPAIDAWSQFVQIAPNPAFEGTRLLTQLPTGETPRVVVSNLYGQTMLETDQAPANGAVFLDTSQWPAGIYQCAVYNNKRLIASQVFVVQKR
ncbi:MAG: T9SS type A sorting domain-containing protein [Thermoanaerobaculia bacterium]|nr:T9SS type A sorting domain-containing protein [Thermoanaerobaculia bacterium]